VKGLGIVTMAVAALAVTAAVVVGVMSIPDVKRYLKMRQM
jgi:Family of unknown function (DUF6893)